MYAGLKNPAFFKQRGIMGKKVLISVPAYDGKIGLGGMMSLVRAWENTKAVCDSLEVGGLAGCCYIAHARNIISNAFMNGNCDELIFLDADIAFDPDALRKIIAINEPVVGGAYPYRNKNKGWPCKIITDANKIPVGDKVRGIIEAEMIPTGFMKIQRGVFEKLQELHPDWKMTTDIDAPNGKSSLWDYFQTGRIAEENNDWYGEDTAFCYFCRKAGFKLWIEPRIDFIHGDVPGNYDEYLRALPLKAGV